MPLDQSSATLMSQLKPHQRRVVQRMTSPSTTGLLAQHGVGSGKTMSSIATWDALGRPDTAVVVPAALQENYKKELRKWVGEVPPNLNIISQQRLARNGTIDGPPPKLLIVDEQHKAREQSSALRAALAKVQAKKRLLLTGTPIFNHPQDISSAINLAAGKTVLPVDRASFNDRYIKTESVDPGILSRLRGIKPGTRQVLQNTNELRQVLKRYTDYHENPKQGFPSSTEEVVKVPMGSNQTDIYNAIMGQAPYWVRWKVKAGLPPGKGELEKLQAFLTGARQVSNSSAGFTRGKGEAAKIDHAFNYLATKLKADPAYKAIVYSNYINSGLNQYAQRLKAQNIPYGEFSGSINKSVRDDMVKQYNANKLRALLISSAGAEGLDTKATSLVQLLDPAWNQAKEQQIIGRAIRFKSHEGLPQNKQNVHIQRYLAQPRTGWFGRLMGGQVDRGVDEYIRDTAMRKQDLSNQMEALIRN